MNSRSQPIPLLTFLVALLVVSHSGCDKINELINGPPPVALAPPPSVVPPAAPAPPPVVAPPPMVNPAEQIAAFKAVYNDPIRRRELTDRAIADLAALPGGKEAITELDLSGTKCTKDVAKYLGDFPALNKVDLGGIPVTDDSIATIGNASAMQELKLSGTSLGDASVTALTGLSQLKKLEIANGCGMSGEGITKVIKDHPLLEVLWIDGSKANDASLAEAGKLPNLRWLYLMNNSYFTDKGLAMVHQNSLEDLAICGNSLINGSGLKARHLKLLVIGKTGLKDVALQNIAGNKDLETLNIQGVNLQDPVLKTIAGKMKNLRQLLIGENPSVTDEGIKSLSVLKNLEILDFNLCPRVSGSSLATFVKSPNLKSIRCQGAMVNKTHVDALNAAREKAGLEPVAVQGVQ